MKEQTWLVLLMALSLAGCGGGSDIGTGTPPSTTYTVSGVITPKIEGVVVSLTSASTANTAMTDVNGVYSFNGIVNDTYTVKPNHAGHTFDPAERINITVNGDVSGVSFTANPATYTISGAISGTLPADRVMVSLTGAGTTVTASAIGGAYSFTGIVNGTPYAVKPSSSAYTFVPAEATNIIANGMDVQGVNFDAKAITSGYSISGRVTQNNTGLPGVIMMLTGAANRVTDADGKYSFDGLANGDYTLTPQQQTGLTITPTSLLKVTINNSNILVNDFTALSSSGTVTRNYTLYIKSGKLIINGNGGTTLDAWGYTDVASGTPKFPGPQLSANAGDTVTVTVVNKHSIPHDFMINGVINGATNDITPILADASRTYRFTASNAGTYLYYDTLNSDINREMGLYGALIVGSADGSPQAWTHPYDFQRIWVVGEMDKPRWNDVANGPNAVTTLAYKPNYFLINGKGGFDGMKDLGTTIAGKVGQTALVRIANGGQFTHSLHFHSNHVTVLAKNGVQESSPKELDVVALRPLETVDVLFYLNQIGNYPMHVHTAQLETANGVYLNGVATLISISPK